MHPRDEMRKLIESVEPLFLNEANTAMEIAKAVDQMGIAIGNDEQSEIIPAIHQALLQKFPGEKNMIRGLMNDPDFIPDVMGYMRHGVAEEPVAEDNSGEVAEALQELQDIQEQLHDLSNHAQSIMKQYFPEDYQQAMAYGALDFGGSQNPYDTTFTKILDDLLSENFN